MEERHPDTAHDEAPGSDFARRLAARRRQALQLLTDQREHVDQIATQFRQRLAELEVRVASEPRQDGDRSEELDQRAEALREREEDFSLREAQLSADRAEIASRQAELQLAREQLERQHLELKERNQQERGELEQRANELETLSAQRKQEQRALETSKEDHRQVVEQIAARRTRLDEQQAPLDKEFEELERQREETRAQRRRVAQQLKTEHAGVLHDRELSSDESERQRAALQRESERIKAQIQEEREVFEREMTRARQQLRHERGQLEEETALLAEARRQWDETRRQSEKNRGEQSAELLAVRQEVDRLTKLLSQTQRHAQESSDSFAALEQDHAQLQRRFAQRSETDESGSAELAELRSEKSTLLSRVSDLERRLVAAEASAAQPSAEDSQQFEDLQRRFQMAVDDVRQLKRRNAELEESLEEHRVAGAPSAASAEGGDWESTKRRLLASLDKDSETPGRMRVEDRLTVEGAIRITDDMVAQRDREIAELRAQIARQNELDEATAEGHRIQTAQHDSAVQVALDQDEIIREERQRLAALKTEWQEKLRQAEIELSVHRAKISRERVELEEQTHKLKEDQAALKADQESGEGAMPGKPRKPARKWLERLGLKDTEKD